MADYTPTIKAVQQALGLQVDGIAGALTWAAIAQRLVPAPPSAPPPAPKVSRPADPVDPRSEQNLDTLLQPAAELGRQLIQLCNAAAEFVAAEVTAKVTSGFRTYEEQEALWLKYKAGGPQAAPPGYSNHNFRLAFDITLFNAGGKPLWDSPLYRVAGRIGQELGLVWGGSWQNSDEPHFEFRPSWARDLSENRALAAYRERLKQGMALT